MLSRVGDDAQVEVTPVSAVMEAFWKPQPAQKLPWAPAAEIRIAAICRENLQTQINANGLQGDGKEGVDGSSPSEGLGDRVYLRAFRGNAHSSVVLEASAEIGPGQEAGASSRGRTRRGPRPARQGP